MRNQVSNYTETVGRVRQLVLTRYEHPTAAVRTYGCQQNVNDSERIKGILSDCGFSIVDDTDSADMAVFNTCAVRENAEDRVFGNVGRLKGEKERRRDLIIALCGCMTQQQHIADRLKRSYPYVDFIFDSNRLSALPGILLRHLETGRRIFEIGDAADAEISEELPIVRDSRVKAWLPIMYGCNNFCTYCIVPYVRHRERSRRSDDILAEFRSLVEQGYRDITLLGQNVNSYGRGVAGELDFAGLLDRLARTPGDYTIRFMTSHPKDASHELFDVIARHRNISRHFHLPLQSGSDEVLRRMNRVYNTEQYLEKVAYARSVVPDITFTSDIIVGFPGETEEDFEKTLDMVRRVRYRSLFTFIYSPREGTPAARMPDAEKNETKVARLIRLNAVQDEITRELEEKMVGRDFRGLAEGMSEYGLSVRLDDNAVVFTDCGRPLTGFVTVHIDRMENKKLFGRIV